jgi:hypothetical protein
LSALTSVNQICKLSSSLCYVNENYRFSLVLITLSQRFGTNSCSAWLTPAHLSWCANYTVHLQLLPCCSAVRSTSLNHRKNRKSSSSHFCDFLDQYDDQSFKQYFDMKIDQCFSTIGPQVNARFPRFFAVKMFRQFGSRIQIPVLIPKLVFYLNFSDVNGRIQRQKYIKYKLYR